MAQPDETKMRDLDLGNEKGQRVEYGHQELNVNDVRPRSRSAIWITRLVSMALTSLFLSLLASKVPALSFLAYGNFGARLGSPCSEHALPDSYNSLVPLEAHIMSKCPDAKDCLKMLVLPTMQQVVDKVNFTLSYIGTPTANDGVDCMHGPAECMGNIIELCAANLYPDPKIYLGFTMCLTRDYEDIPQKSLVEDCALEHGIDFERLNECAVRDQGGFGMGLLRDSVKRSTDVGVTTSCTVRLDEEVYCIRDDGHWKSCPNGAGVNDLVIAIEKLYRSSSEARRSPSIAH